MGLILLARHGQASWGAADYDNLSERGHEQSRVLGEWLSAAGVKPTLMVAGSMRRHRQTAEGAAHGAGWPVDLEIDQGWDEFDHVEVLRAHHAPTEWDAEAGSARDINDLFDAAVLRWSSGDHDADYPETFTAFRERVVGAMSRTAENLGSGETAIVFTSGGPIGWLTADLLGGGLATWERINPVTVNASLTKVTLGQRGTTLISFNEHGHLPAGLVTYR